MRLRELVLSMLGGLLVVALLPGGFSHTCSQDERYCASTPQLLVIGLICGVLIGGSVAYLFGVRGLRYFLTPSRWRSRNSEGRDAVSDADVPAFEMTPAWTAWSALDAETKDEVHWLVSRGMQHPVEGVAGAARGWADVILAAEQRQAGEGSWPPMSFSLILHSVDPIAYSQALDLEATDIRWARRLAAAKPYDPELLRPEPPAPWRLFGPRKQVLRLLLPLYAAVVVAFGWLAVTRF